MHAAVEAFARDGYQACSLARIASEVGLSQAGLLHHFPTKEDLLAAVLDERDRLDTRRFLADGAEGIEMLTALEKLVEYNTYLTGMVQSFTVLAGESTADLHPAREWFTTRYDNVRTMIADELRKGVAHGDVRPDTDCDAIAAEIVATIDGLQLQWLLDPEKVDMPALFRAYAARLRAALKP
ncbi:TetR family transcriptional regulator [Saccharopolyspora sp. ID03-671]|uniref:TetR family transcriptional regulator n=1 Tax=Saccharopolyspora sp. ID03-671 TaxID=3073066 RepID=UPI00324D37A7